MTTKMIEKDGKRRVQKSFPNPAVTQQDHRDKTNINNIVAKHRTTGLVPVNPMQGLYGDFTGAVDYHTALNKIQDAQNDFMSLPSSLRKRFKNNPAELIAFINDEANRQEAIDLKLIPGVRTGERKPEPKPEAAKVPEGTKPKA